MGWGQRLREGFDGGGSRRRLSALSTVFKEEAPEGEEGELQGGGSGSDG